MKIGFIGAGNMGGALARAVVKTGEEVYLYDCFSEKAASLAKELGCHTASAEQMVASCDYIFIGVKPQSLSDLFEQLRPLLANAKKNLTWISMAAGISVSTVQSALDGSPVIRIMPNTPVGTGKGAVLYSCAKNVAESAKEGFLKLLSQAGILEELPERLIDAGCAVSGCGPAFVCIFAEALADGGVACGLSRKQARLLAAQTLSGTAELLLRDDAEPAALKDAVCSPGGTTIEGVLALENGKFRASVMQAVVSAYKKAKTLE